MAVTAFLQLSRIVQFTTNLEFEPAAGPTRPVDEISSAILACEKPSRKSNQLRDDVSFSQSPFDAQIYKEYQFVRGKIPSASSLT
jgi:hypothetical protein